MTELERIADQVQRAYAGKAWHGPSVLEALQGVTPEIAARRSIANAHSIWELAHHICAWADIPRRRIEGERFEVTPELNFPPVIENTAAGWRESLDRLAESQSRLIDVIRSLDAQRLDEPIMQDGPTIYTLLQGIAQHHAYHAGQIVLIRKALHG
jgi:uncharacterized damage-inducible protein DinB